MLASLTGENRSLEDVPGAELVYGVRSTRKANDPAIMGAYLAVQNPAAPASTANPHLIMAVGNGDLWVVDDGEDIAIGDYLISSAVAGHAMRERSQFETTYIVARAAERCGGMRSTIWSRRRTGTGGNTAGSRSSSRASSSTGPRRPCCRPSGPELELVRAPRRPSRRNGPAPSSGSKPNWQHPNGSR